MAPLLSAVGLFYLGSPAARAQAVTAGPDSVRVQAGPPVADSLRKTERLLWWHVSRPQKSVILSALLPGAGQIYNRKYWKLPLVYGALGGTIYGEYFYWKAYVEFRDGYRARQRRASRLYALDDPLVQDYGRRSGNQQIYPYGTGDAKQKNALSAYRTQRDTFFGYIALAYGMQVLDALVDGHLHDFDVSDNLSLNMQPYYLPLPSGSSAGLALTFTLRPAAPQPPAPRRSLTP